MWELIIELVEDSEIYFWYRFKTLGQAIDFISRNENHNAEHCIYTIEKVGEIE